MAASTAVLPVGAQVFAASVATGESGAAEATQFVVFENALLMGFAAVVAALQSGGGANRLGRD